MTQVTAVNHWYSTALDCSSIQTLDVLFSVFLKDIFWSNTSVLHRFILINVLEKEETLFCFKFCMG